MTEARLTDDAIAYVRGHGWVVMVRSSQRRGCCGGVVGVPVAELGEPERVEGFDVIDRDGVRLYVERRLAATPGESVTIGIEGFARWRRLWVSGLEAWMVLAEPHPDGRSMA